MLAYVGRIGGELRRLIEALLPIETGFWRQRQLQLMDDGAAAKRSRLDLIDASSFRMEDLPEEIHPLIFSLLSLKEAASTSAVSQNWRRLWTQHPNLCFDGCKDKPTTDTESVKIDKAKFIETVNSIVQQHRGIGLNKFSVRCRLDKDSSRVLDRWIHFATASKAKIIDINLLPERNNAGPTEQVYHLPLEAFTGGAQHHIHSLFITNVSINPHDLDTCTKLRTLHLHCVQIIGHLPGLLSSCCSLEDFEMIACRGVTDQLNIPHPLDKLRRLLLSNMRMIQSVEFHHVPNLSHFEYKGLAIPVVLGGCSKLHNVTLDFHQTSGEEANNKVMGHVFHGIPGVSSVKLIKVYAFMWSSQQWVWSPLQATARPSCVFMNLRHLIYEVTFVTQRPNTQSGILQLAHYLAFAPQLETLEVHMAYLKSSDYWLGEGISYRMPRHDHLKTVYMSGFQCYRAEVELLYGILDMGAALEHVTIEPRTRNDANSFCKPEYKICEWADRTSQRFGKAITVVTCH